MSTWDFDAPTYVDFGNNAHEESCGVEDYFNYDHENQTSLDFQVADREGVLAKDAGHEKCSGVRQTFEKSSDINDQVNSIPHESECSPQNDSKGEMKTDPPLPDKLHNETEPVDSLDEDNQSDTPEPEQHIEQTSCAAVKSVFQASTPAAVTEDASQTQPIDSLEEDNATDTPEEKMEENQSEDCKEVKEAEMVEENTCSADTESPERMDQSQDAESPGPSSVVPSNLITPSREAAWKKAPQQALRRQLAMTRQAKDPKRRSRQLEKAKEIRRSARIRAVPAQEPPKKKQKKKEVIKLVEPHTPTVLKHARSQSMTKIKSTQERELEEIEMLKHQAKERMKEAQRSLKKALKEPKRPETPNAHRYTKAKEFKFLTDERIKSTHSMETRSQELSGVDFAKGLRQHPPSPTKLKPTVVKPFHFSNSRKRAIEPQETASTSKPYPFAPMSKAVVNFNGKARPRTATATQDRKGPLKATRMLTAAKTPNLESTKRVRKVTVTSAKEIEDKEVEEMKSYHFRARPADRKILNHPHKLPEPKRASGTKAIGFNLEMEKRIQDKPKAEKEASPVKKFKANPIPKEVIMGEHLKPVMSAPRTVPQSPAFRLKNRMEVHQKNKENVEMQRAIAEKEELEAAARRRRCLSNVGVKKVDPKKTCQVVPFSFDTRDKETLAKKEKKIQEIKEAEKAAASAFKAQPLRDFENPEAALPEKQVRPHTKAEPFHLLSDERGAVRAAKWREEVEGEMKKLKELSEFKANTEYVNVIHSNPFAPRVDKKCTTEFKEFSLHTNERASQRSDFDARQKDREARALEDDERIAQERELEEQMRAAEMRKNTVHKATAIRKYKPVVVERSTKQLTLAQSPQFSDRFYKNA